MRNLIIGIILGWLTVGAVFATLSTEEWRYVERVITLLERIEKNTRK